MLRRETTWQNPELGPSNRDGTGIIIARVDSGIALRRCGGAGLPPCPR